MPSTIQIESGPVTTVTLNRPDVRNAFNETLVHELHEWAMSIAADGTVRVAVLQGAGPAFCAGADLQWMQRMAGYSHLENIEDAQRAAALLYALDSLPVPLIGRIHGAAMGLGVGLAALCDITIAADDVRFGLTETTLGLVPAIISPYVLRAMGLSAARALALHGQPFTAAQALAAGLVEEVVPVADLDAAVDRAVARFSKASPAAVAATKALFHGVAGQPPSDVMALTAEAIAEARASADGQEGLRAFFEKRAPRWATSLNRSRT